jgi:uncharacterized protein YjiS (DUF1127 family)
MTNDNDSTPIMWQAQHGVDRIVRQLSATVVGAVEAIETQRRRGALERQLDTLDDRAIADIGIVRAQIPAIAAAWPDAPQLLRRMMERLGVAPESLVDDPDLRREIEWNCVACPNRGQCRRWLKSMEPADAYRTFCPNAPGLDRLATAQAAIG